MGRLSLKVVPGSSRDEIVGWLGDSLKVKVKAPPDKGRANEAVVGMDEAAIRPAFPHEKLGKSVGIGATE